MEFQGSSWDISGFQHIVLPVEDTFSISWHGKPVSVVWEVAEKKIINCVFEIKMYKTVLRWDAVCGLMI